MALCKDTFVIHHLVTTCRRIMPSNSSSSFRDRLAVSDLTPNLGLFWYFFIEMFDQFRSFFLVVFQIHVFIFAIPISIKLRYCLSPDKDVR